MWVLSLKCLTELVVEDGLGEAHDRAFTPGARRVARRGALHAPVGGAPVALRRVVPRV